MAPVRPVATGRFTHRWPSYVRFQKVAFLQWKTYRSTVRARPAGSAQRTYRRHERLLWPRDPCRSERLASSYGFRPDFCNGYDPESKGIVENLVGYAKLDLVVPQDLVGAEVAGADEAARAWCTEVNGRPPAFPVKK